MTFDYSKGKKPKYVVQIYSTSEVDFSDRYYYHEYREAKKKFEAIRINPDFSNVIVSIYDIDKDVRKDFARL